VDVLIDVRRALGEQVAQPSVDTDHIAQSGAMHLPLGTEPVGDLEPEASVVDPLAGPEVGVDPPAVHG
jgi:hypothetical protein